MSESAELAGKIAAVTGSSSGIGRAVALELAAGGAAVIVHGRANKEGAERTAAEIQALGPEATVVMLDLSEPAGQESFAAACRDWRKRVDILVNCAGADVLTGEASSLAFEEKLLRLWKVDVLATMRLSRILGAGMKEQGSGTIVTIGWEQAERGMEGDSGEMFAAAKGAVTAFTRSLARSLAPEVRVNCIAPGWIKTKWGDGASAAWQRRAVAESLLGRWGEPEDVARAARFLAGPAASFISAETLAVGGGFRHVPITDARR